MMRYFYLGLVSFATILILWINFLLFKPAAEYPEREKEVLTQLNFLEQELKEHNLGQKMQQLFPEGYIFIHALYGLAWAELALSMPEKESLQAQSVKEALYAYDAIHSNKGRSTFSHSLDPPYGIFYAGWKNYLLAKILTTKAPLPNAAFYQKQFQKNCAEIATAMQKKESPFLASYGGQAWPADMCLAVASLALHDNLYLPKYQKELTRWVKLAREKVDPQTGMLPHKVDSFSGTTLETPRGGSMSLMVRILAEIDPAFGKEQYQQFKEHFVSTALGLPAVREYPKGIWGLGDVDSGPVILGVGFPATIVSIGTFAVYGDYDLSNAQYQTVNAFGFPLVVDQQKSYLAGLLPMADAFIAWSRATSLSTASIKANEKPPGKGLFHFISFVFLLLIWSPVLKTLLFKNRSKAFLSN